MKSILTLLIFIFCLTNCIGQNKGGFDIQEIFIDKMNVKKQKFNFTKEEDIFYEDEDYIVTKTCKGEFGGSIWFKSKKTGEIYSCESTCPKAINKINNKYIITNSLAHMSGVSEIIEIYNPSKLSIFQEPEPRKKKNGISFHYVGDKESKSRKGVKTIWSESNILTYMSFLYQEKLYHIMTKESGTYLTTLNKNKLVILDLISKDRIWSHYTVNKVDKNHEVLFLGRKNRKTGYIEVVNSRIRLVRYK